MRIPDRRRTGAHPTQSPLADRGTPVSPVGAHVRVSFGATGGGCSECSVLAAVARACGGVRGGHMGEGRTVKAAHRTWDGGAWDVGWGPGWSRRPRARGQGGPSSVGRGSRRAWGRTPHGRGRPSGVGPGRARGRRAHGQGGRPDVGRGRGPRERRAHGYGGRPDVGRGPGGPWGRRANHRCGRGGSRQGRAGE